MSNQSRVHTSGCTCTDSPHSCRVRTCCSRCGGWLFSTHFPLSREIASMKSTKSFIISRGNCKIILWPAVITRQLLSCKNPQLVTKEERTQGATQAARSRESQIRMHMKSKATQWQPDLVIGLNHTQDACTQHQQTGQPLCNCQTML